MSAPRCAEPARCAGRPMSRGAIRVQPEDFQVDEQLPFEPAGQGEHVLLRVEKTGHNTADAARLLANHGGAKPRDVGYSGLKDRRAVCRQWFTLPYREGVPWEGFSAAGLRVLECHRHDRKLRRGAHARNHFRILARLSTFHAGDLEQRLGRVTAGGVPNYFGEQRVGRHYRAHAERLAEGGRLSRLQRGMTLSALRAGLFNLVLEERVRRGNWNHALTGEYLNLDGTRSGFTAAPGDEDIEARVARMDLHPTGPLCGAGPSGASGEAVKLEQVILAPWQRWVEVLQRQGLRTGRRPTRCIVRGLRWRFDPGDATLELRFGLGRGQFATAVLRELLDYEDVTGTPPGA